MDDAALRFDASVESADLVGLSAEKGKGAGEGGRVGEVDDGIAERVGVGLQTEISTSTSECNRQNAQ